MCCFWMNGDPQRSQGRCCFMTQISRHKQRWWSKVNTLLKTAAQVRNSTKCHLEQHFLNRASWHKNIVKVVVCIVNAQTHLVQSVHCVHWGCGLPHVVQCLVFQQRSGILPAAASFTQSSLHFCLRNVPWPFETDVEKYNYGHAIASLFSHGILKSDRATEVN